MTNEEISKAIAEGAKVIEEIDTYQSLDLVYMFSNLTLDQQRYCLKAFALSGFQEEIEKDKYDYLELINEIDKCLYQELVVIFLKLTIAQQFFCLKTFILCGIREGVDEFTKNLAEEELMF